MRNGVYPLREQARSHIGMHFPVGASLLAKAVAAVTNHTLATINIRLNANNVCPSPSCG